MTTSEQVALADRLANARRQAKLSQQNVADQTSISRSGISDIERGLRGVDALELKALAGLYGTDVSTLLGEVEAAPPAAKLVIGVGGPGYVRLNAFGALIREAYDHVPYLVGSAIRGKVWRDVDVRLMLPDEEFNALFGSQRPFGLNPLFSLLSAGVSALGKEMTGLPIDFQFQPVSHANEHYDGFRQPLGIWFRPRPESGGTAPKETP